MQTKWWNKLSTWYKNLSTKKKIVFYLWIIIPIFIVLLVSCLCGTTVTSYKKDFSATNNQVTVVSANFDQIFTFNKKSDDYSLNNQGIANVLASVATKKAYPSGQDANVWLPYLENNDYMLYLNASNPYTIGVNNAYIQLINLLPQAKLATNELGQYDTNYVAESNKDKYFNGNSNDGLPSYYNNAYLSLNQSVFTNNGSGWTYTLVLTQLQLLRHQYPDVDITLTNVPLTSNNN